MLGATAPLPQRFESLGQGARVGPEAPQRRHRRAMAQALEHLRRTQDVTVYVTRVLVSRRVRLYVNR